MMNEFKLSFNGFGDEITYTNSTEDKEKYFKYFIFE